MFAIIGPCNCRLFIDPLHILNNLIFCFLKTTSYWSSMGMHLRIFGSTVVIRSVVVIQGYHEPIYRFKHPQRTAFSSLCKTAPTSHEHTTAWAFFCSTAQPYLSCHQGAKRARQHDTGLCQSSTDYTVVSQTLQA